MPMGAPQERRTEAYQAIEIPEGDWPDRGVCDVRCLPVAVVV
jgi:hypothetical protein